MYFIARFTPRYAFVRTYAMLFQLNRVTGRARCTVRNTRANTGGYVGNERACFADGPDGRLENVFFVVLSSVFQPHRRFTIFAR